MSEIIDLTHVIDLTTPVYPGDPPVNIHTIYEQNSGVTTTKFSLGTHTGTHLDTPRHILPEGKDLGQIPLDHLIGLAVCLRTDTRSGEIELKADDLKQIAQWRATWVLIASKFDQKWGAPSYFTGHPYLSLTTAARLAGAGIHGVGIDCPSVDAPGTSLPVHKLLLEREILIVENLRGLERLPVEAFHLYILPLNIKAEAAPVRVIAVIEP